MVQGQVQPAIDLAGEWVEARTVAHDSFYEVFLTGTLPPSHLPPVEGVARIYSAMARSLRDQGILPLTEKAYGSLAFRAEAARARHDAFRAAGLDPATPFTWIEGHSPWGSAFSGMQVWGILPLEPARVRVDTVVRADGCLGRLCSANGLRMLVLPGVTGRAPDGTLPPDRIEQAERMFARAAELLREQGFAYSQVARTWIYLARILDWYAEFNGVRTGHHARHGIGSACGDAAFPASTGIEGRCGNEECSLDLLAIDADAARGASVRPIRHTPRQGEAFRYGSAFSRAVCVESEGRRTVFVSGTASIDPAGRTLHRGEAAAQTRETLGCIAALLREQGGGLADIRAATVFVKDREAAEGYCAARKAVGVPFPSVIVLADVCRADLLVEVEAAAGW